MIVGRAQVGAAATQKKKAEKQQQESGKPAGAQKRVQKRTVMHNKMGTSGGSMSGQNLLKRSAWPLQRVMSKMHNKMVISRASMSRQNLWERSAWPLQCAPSSSALSLRLCWSPDCRASLTTAMKAGSGR